MNQYGSRFDPEKIDLHMHSTVSDGTDTPAELLGKVKEQGLELFSVTDHDAVKAGAESLKIRGESDPFFITGVEFSCKDEGGKYHILGYRYDPDAEPVHALVEKSHEFRMRKVRARMDFLRDEYNFVFPEEETEKLFALDNPGKPHIGNLMAKYGYAKSKDEAITEYINKCSYRSEYLRPKEAIKGILESGGIPVLAHPSFGNGNDYIVGHAMRERLYKLKGYGLLGVEAFYSGFSQELTSEILAFAKEPDFGFYVTAGSDYHGKNKTVLLGDTGYSRYAGEIPPGMVRFMEIL